MKIETGMVLAAGKGERLRPLTDACPKPLIVVGRKSMLDHAIDHLKQVGVKKVVVNVCHNGDMIIDHLKSRKSPQIVISKEDERLETGGGVLNALSHLSSDYFFVINGDILWSDAETPTLELMEKAWKPSMDALLLMVPLKNSYGYDGEGDYDMNSKGKLSRHHAAGHAEYVYGGVQILNARLFEGEEVGQFSLNKLYDKAESKGTLFGLEHKGLWFHVGTPEALMETRAWFEEHELDAH
ncbi:MAG: nucleotidyltransferase family protein [Alphaproteobacteria bacterium]